VILTLGAQQSSRRIQRRRKFLRGAHPERILAPMQQDAQVTALYNVRMRAALLRMRSAS